VLNCIINATRFLAPKETKHAITVYIWLLFITAQAYVSNHLFRFELGQTTNQPKPALAFIDREHHLNNTQYITHVHAIYLQFSLILTATPTAVGGKMLSIQLLHPLVVCDLVTPRFQNHLAHHGRRGTMDLDLSRLSIALLGIHPWER